MFVLLSGPATVPSVLAHFIFFGIRICVCLVFGPLSYSFLPVFSLYLLAASASASMIPVKAPVVAAMRLQIYARTHHGLICLV